MSESAAKDDAEVAGREVSGRGALRRAGAWLASRWPEIAVFAAAEGLICFTLDTAHVSGALIVLVGTTLAVAGAATLLAQALRGARLVRELRDVAASAAPLDAAANVAEPHHPEGRAAFAALEAVGADAAARIGDVARQARDQRDYTESWVHEIKTPIAAAKLAIENHPGPGSAQVAAQLDRVGFYVDQALYVARSGSVAHDYLIRELDVRTLVLAAVRERRRSLFDAGFQIDLDGLPEGAQVRGDQKWLVFILGQLIDNAVKYRKPEGGIVSGSGAGIGDGAGAAELGGGHVKAASSEAAALGAADSDATPSERVKPRLSFTLTQEGTGARAVSVLAVEDNGLGIPAADLPRVFDRAFTGARGRADGSKATGIGLYLVRELASKMGLAVRAESVEGEFTRVSIVFPS